MSYVISRRQWTVALLCTLTALSSDQARAQGIAWGWGSNSLGNLGTGDSFWARTAVPTAAPNTIIQVAAKWRHTLFLDSGGNVWAAGHNTFGQLGDGTTAHSLTPIPVQGLAGVLQVAAGSDHSLALRSDGTVWAWGNNYQGAIGPNGGSESAVPVQVTGLPPIKAIGAGLNHSLAVSVAGEVWCWGANLAGQLGDGNRSFVPEKRPVQAVDLAGVVSVAAGNYHSLACLASGQIYAWGANDDGQLGTGGYGASYIPVQVPGITDVASVAAAGYFSMALSTDGLVRTWGHNGKGQLGDGTYDRRDTPAVVPNLSGVAEVSAGKEMALARLADGTVLSWGSNSSSALGHGTDDYAVPTPTPVPGLLQITAICGADEYGLAVGPAFRFMSTTYAPSRTGVIGETALLRGYLRRVSTLAWMPNRLIRFEVAGTVVGSAMTGNDGMAVLPWVIGPGDPTRTVVVSFAGDTTATGSSRTSSLTAESYDTRVLVDDSSGVIGGYALLRAYLYAPGDRPLRGQTLTFKVDGTEVGSDVTRPAGYAQLGYTVAEAGGAGDRTLAAEFAGSGGWLASSGAAVLHATKNNVSLYCYGNTARRGHSVWLQARLRRWTDEALLVGRGSDFRVLGTLVGSATTVDTGWALLAWPVPAAEALGVHILTASFAGDAAHEPASGSGVFQVIP